MISLFLIFFIKISYIKDQNIEININCGGNLIYDSINYRCVNCFSGNINENICYSERPRSLYIFNYELIKEKEECDDTIEKLTELDNNGNWLGGVLNCSKIIDDFSYLNGKNIISEINLDNIPQAQRTFYLYTLNDANRTKPTENRQFITINPLILSSNVNEVNYFKYYYESCINQRYEQSCQYIANLCTLAMYYANNIYCIFINILSRNLSESNLLDE